MQLQVFLYFYVSYLLQIETAASGALDTAKSALGGGGDKRRRKRHGDDDDDDEDDDKYACGKLLLFGTAYRSCVRKVAITREGKATIVCHYLVLDFPILLSHVGHTVLSLPLGKNKCARNGLDSLLHPSFRRKNGKTFHI